MRGKESYSDECDIKNRITPAYAGKSGILHQMFGAEKDHPRVCGEKTKKIP